jgi:hypothetical protein
MRRSKIRCRSRVFVGRHTSQRPRTEVRMRVRCLPLPPAPPSLRPSSLVSDSQRVRCRRRRATRSELALPRGAAGGRCRGRRAKARDVQHDGMSSARRLMRSACSLASADPTAPPPPDLCAIFPAPNPTPAARFASPQSKQPLPSWDARNGYTDRLAGSSCPSHAYSSSPSHSHAASPPAIRRRKSPPHTIHRSTGRVRPVRSTSRTPEPTRRSLKASRRSRSPTHPTRLPAVCRSAPNRMSRTRMERRPCQSRARKLLQIPLHLHHHHPLQLLLPPKARAILPSPVVPWLEPPPLPSQMAPTRTRLW